VHTKRIEGIGRTARRETTVLPQIGAQQHAVQLDQRDEGFLHCCAIRIQCLVSTASICRLFMALTTGLHITTRSTAGSREWLRRKLSRTSRLIRLRATASAAHLREIARPSLACPRSLGHANIVKARSAERTARSNTRRNSCALLRRLARRKYRRSTVSVNRSRTQPSPLPRAPTLQHLAPTGRAHAYAKAVRALAPQITGLKGLFHLTAPA
jgi:hypothetical protein